MPCTALFVCAVSFCVSYYVEPTWGTPQVCPLKMYDGRNPHGCSSLLPGDLQAPHVGAAARCPRTLLGNYTPQTDPHKKALDSNIGTKKTAGKWVSHQSLVV